MHHRGLEPNDRPLIASLLASLEAFTPEECAVALELVDHRLTHPESDDYRFILSFAPGAELGGAPEQLAGYLCYGRTPMTQSTYDLYWLGTSPRFARTGVASGLVADMERELARDGGGLIRVETGSREGHGAAVRFYDGAGFSRTATLVDFYAPGDDLIIFTRRVSAGVAEGDPAMDEPALHDAAFGYRDYVVERDFLLACAQRFGERKVQRVLAWACGAGRHLTAFAEAGISGVGADGSATMVAFARRIADPRAPHGSHGEHRARAAAVRFVEAGLTSRVDLGPPFDLSFVPLSAIHQLSSEAAFEEHLRVAAAALAPGGVHVIEATHPSDLAPSGVHHTEWTEVRGDQVIDARFRMHLDKLTEGHRVPVTLEVVCSTNRKSAPACPPRALQRLRQEDTWLIPDLEGWRAIIGRVGELRLAAALGDFNVGVPFDHAAAWRLLLVLKHV